MGAGEHSARHRAAGDNRDGATARTGNRANARARTGARARANGAASSRPGARGSSVVAVAERPDEAAPARRRAHAHPAPRPMKDPPGIAPCLGLDDLRALSPAHARAHVDAYLHAVMPFEDADAFEALAYRWELHLVDVEQMLLVHGVDVDAKKLRSYRMRLARGGGFPPLVGLGGEGKRVTEGVLLCDGYHRAMAIRNAGIPFVWVWLAVGLWREDARPALTTVAATAGA